VRFCSHPKVLCNRAENPHKSKCNFELHSAFLGIAYILWGNVIDLMRLKFHAKALSRNLKAIQDFKGASKTQETPSQ
jgi:hypothetical protein